MCVIPFLHLVSRTDRPDGIHTFFTIKDIDGNWVRSHIGCEKYHLIMEVSICQAFAYIEKKFIINRPRGPKGRGVAPIGARRVVYLYFSALLNTT